MDFGERLFKLRKAKNLSQEEVADLLKVTRQTVSKWETNQSVPEFDKIVPLCELFEIGVEELLTGKRPEEKEVAEIVEEEKNVPSREEIRKKSAEVVSTSVFLYIFAVVEIMLGIAFFGLNPILVTSGFLLIIAWATMRIIRHYMSIPKFEETIEEKQEKSLIKQINGIIGAICTIIYFIVSFVTMAWHVTWVIFIVDGLLCQIVKLFFILYEKEDENSEE